MGLNCPYFVHCRFSISFLGRSTPSRGGDTRSPLSVSSATRPLRVRTSARFRLDSDSIVDGIADPLLAAKVSFGCLHRYMAE